MHHRIIRLAFAIADTIAWLLAIWAAIGAATTPFVAPIQTKMAHQPSSILSITVTCIMLLAVSAGAYATTKRYAGGLFLILIPSITAWMTGRWNMGVAFPSITFALLATPFFLVFLDAQKGKKYQPTHQARNVEIR